MGLSLSHLLLVLVVVLIVFGAGKLPQIMGDLAKGLKAFKHGLHEPDSSPPSAEPTHPSKKSLPTKGASGKASSLKSASPSVERKPPHTP